MIVRMLTLGLAFTWSVSLFAEPDAASKFNDAQQYLSSATKDLNRLYDAKLITPKDDAADAAFVKAIRNLEKASALVTELAAAGKGNAKLDSYVAEARLIQRIMSGYFAEKDFFGYRLKRGPINLELEVGGALDEVHKKLPFLRVGGNGHVDINPGEQVVTQFNALKSEYYGLLIEAAHIDPSDSRVKALADWGENTKVITGDEDKFGTQVLTTQEVWKLELK